MQRMPGAGPGAGKRYKLCPAGGRNQDHLLCKPFSAGIHQVPGLQHQGLYQPPLLYPP